LDFVQGAKKGVNVEDMDEPGSFGYFASLVFLRIAAGK
jgi:hypothetical protein